jgi:RimJ/RimL family protein N-acetyltransferase
LYKVKAQIYPQNFRVKTLLKNSGFIYEATLKNETLRAGKPQDIEVYSLYRDYYYKTR